MRRMLMLAAGAGVLGLSTGAAAAPITYMGSQQVGSILATYSITTDGSIGDIDASHITAFNVSLADMIAPLSYGRTTSGGTGSANGTFLASASTLTVPLFESLSLYTNATGPLGSFAGNLMFNYNGTKAQIADAAHLATQPQSLTVSNRTVAFATLAPAVTAAVPEPAAWGMMMLGMGALGLAMRRQRVRARVRFA